MKNYILIIAIFASLSAQAAHGTMKQHQSQVDKLESRLDFLSIVLDLSDDQVTDIRSLQEDHIESVNKIRSEYEPVIKELENALTEIRQNSEGNFEASREAARNIRAEYKEQLDPMGEAINTERTAFGDVLVQVFSEEQKQKFESLRSFNQEKRAMERKYHKRH